MAAGTAGIDRSEEIMSVSAWPKTSVPRFRLKLTPGREGRWSSFAGAGIIYARRVILAFTTSSFIGRTHRTSDKPSAISSRQERNATAAFLYTSCTNVSDT